MKKIFVFSLMLLLLVGMVSAMPVKGGGKNFIFDDEGNSITTSKMQEQFKGLENAMIHVKNGNASERLLGNVERFREKHQERFNSCNNCSIVVDETLSPFQSSEVTIKRQARFMFFDVEAKDKYVLYSDGDIYSQKKNLWQWMYEKNIAKLK